MITKNELIADIEKMGIKKNDTVIIHTSFKKIGNVSGGPNGLIDAFSEYLSEGLFIVPTHTWSNVNRNSPVYDVRSTVPCIGAVPCAAAFRGDGYRSLHPTHSVWAKGKNAEEFIKGEETAETPTPVGGVWSRLAEVGAKILLIGVGNDKNTFIHSIDEAVDTPDRLQDTPWQVSITDHNGNTVSHPMRGHFTSHTNDVSQYFPNFEKALIHFGAQRSGKLGLAEVKIVDAKKCEETIKNILLKAKCDLCSSHSPVPEELYL